MGVGFHEYATGWGVVVTCPPTGETVHCLKIASHALTSVVL